MLWIVEGKIKGLTQAVYYVPNDFINILFGKSSIFQALLYCDFKILIMQFPCCLYLFWKLVLAQMFSVKAESTNQNYLKQFILHDQIIASFLYHILFLWTLFSWKKKIYIHYCATAKAVNSSIPGINHIG